MLPVRRDLSEEQWDAVDAGRLTAPTGTVYDRRSTRLGRRQAALLVDSGRLVVTHWPGGLPERTEVVWHDGDDARTAWEGARASVTGDARGAASRRPVVTAGRWESADGDALLVLTWHH